RVGDGFSAATDSLDFMDLKIRPEPDRRKAASARPCCCAGLGAHATFAPSTGAVAAPRPAGVVETRSRHVAIPAGHPPRIGVDPRGIAGPEGDGPRTRR